jgi:hypothetical protein
VPLLYVITTCGSLFFSKTRMMVIFGAANPGDSGGNGVQALRIHLATAPRTPLPKELQFGL